MIGHRTDTWMHGCSLRSVEVNPLAKREKGRRKVHKNTKVHQWTPAKKHPSAQVVPGGAGGDANGEEGEKVVDGV